MNMLSGFPPSLHCLNQFALENVSSFKAHYDRLFIITKDDMVLAAGNNTYGYLGLGHDMPVDTFSEIAELNGQSVVDIVCGDFHNAALTEQGDVWIWGAYGYSIARKPIFYDRPYLFLEGQGITSIKSGIGHCLAKSKYNQIWAWGDNSCGQLAREPDEQAAEERHLPKYTIDSLNGQNIAKIECGSTHSVALMSDGRLFGWGDNKYNQLNLGKKTTSRSVPTHIRYIGNESTRFKSVAAGMIHTVLITTDGQLFVLGGVHLPRARLLTRFIQPPSKVNFERVFVLGLPDNPRFDHDEITFIACDWLYNYYVWGHLRSGERQECPTRVESGYFRNIGAVLDKYSVVWMFPEMLRPSRIVAFSKIASLEKSIDNLQINELAAEHKRKEYVEVEEAEKPSSKLESDAENTVPKSERKSCFADEIAQLFDQTTMSDFEFRFETTEANARKVLPAHRFVLNIASNYWPAIIAGSDHFTVKNECNHVVFYEYIRFLYQNETELESLDDMLQLYNFVKRLEEPKAMDYCVDMFLDKFLSVSTCRQLYEFSLEQQLPDMEANIVEFMADNLVEFTMSRSFIEMPAEMAKDLHVKFTKYWFESGQLGDEEYDDEEDDEAEDETESEEEVEEKRKKNSNKKAVSSKNSPVIKVDNKDGDRSSNNCPLINIQVLNMK